MYIFQATEDFAETLRKANPSFQRDMEIVDSIIRSANHLQLIARKMPLKSKRPMLKSIKKSLRHKSFYSQIDRTVRNKAMKKAVSIALANSTLSAMIDLGIKISQPIPKYPLNNSCDGFISEEMKKEYTFLPNGCGFLKKD